MDLILRRAKIARDKGLLEADIGIENGRIARIGDLGGIYAKKEIDLDGALVVPGVIDSHVHFGLEMMGVRSPDDYINGSRTAVFGGVTTVMDFTEQMPGEPLSKSFERKKSWAERDTSIDFLLHINVTDFSTDYRGEIRKLIENGVKSFKFFTAYRKRGLMAQDDQLFDAMTVIKEAGGIAMVHCENGDIAAYLTEKFIKEGKTEPIYHARSRPDYVEAMAIAKVLYIAEATDCPVYIVHVSTRKGLEEIRRAKKRGVKVYVETCPHYLFLTEEKLKEEEGFQYIATPPLRKEEDNRALLEALADGTIDVVATDHASYSTEQKRLGGGHFYKTPSGLPGTETLFPLLFTLAYGKGVISIERLIELVASNPAKIFGLPNKGKIEEGFDADLVVVDADKEIELTRDSLHGGTDFCPYHGFKLKGFPLITIRRGEILLHNGEYSASPGTGKYLYQN